MKLKNWMGVAFLLLAGTGFSQDWSTDKYQYDELYDGYVITKEGEKLGGYVKYRNRFIMQEEVIFYVTKDGKGKKRYDAKDLLEYSVADKTYHCLRFSGETGYPEVRGLLVVKGEGCIKEYVWYDRASGYNTFTLMDGETEEDLAKRKFPPTTVYHKKGDDLPVTNTYFKDDFNKKMSTYIKDNKELARKVKSGASNYDKVMNIDAIFAEYNKDCK